MSGAERSEVPSLPVLMVTGALLSVIPFGIVWWIEGAAPWSLAPLLAGAGSGVGVVAHRNRER